MPTCNILMVTNVLESTSFKYLTDTLGLVQLPNVRNFKQVIKI